MLNRVIYRVSQVLMRCVTHSLWGLRVEGLENLPREPLHLPADPLASLATPAP